MRLENYPRPPEDNGRGFHWSPAQQNQGVHDWDKWQAELFAMKVKWLKLMVSPDEKSFEICRRLVSMRIMPVVRYYATMPSHIDGSMLANAQRLRDEMGVSYIERVNEPDADVEWDGYHKPDGWERQVAEINIHDARELQAIGCIPVLAMYNAPPPKNCIQLMLEVPGGREVLEVGCVLSIHNYGKGRPLEYPNDSVHMFGDQLSEADYYTVGLPPDHWTPAQIQREVWRNLTREQINLDRNQTKNPYDNIMTNITNYRMMEYWSNLWAAEGLSKCPIIGTEAGWEVDDKADDKYPEPTVDLHAQYFLQAARYQDGQENLTLLESNGTPYEVSCPSEYFTSAWWISWAAIGGSPGAWEAGSWYTDVHNTTYALDPPGQLPIVQAMKDQPDQVRADGPVPLEWADWGLYPADDWGINPFSDKLNYIRPKLEIIHPQGPGWYLKSFQVEYPTDTGNRFAGGYLFCRAFRDGVQTPDVKFEFTFAENIVVADGKTSPDWTDLFMTAPRPLYNVQIEGQNSVQIRNMGLGLESGPSYDHCTFIIEVEWRQGHEPPDPPVDPPDPPIDPPDPPVDPPVEPPPVAYGGVRVSREDYEAYFAKYPDRLYYVAKVY